MDSAKPPRLLGKGRAPSQPRPVYLAPQEPKGPNSRKRIGYRLGFAVLVVVILLVSGVVVWRKLGVSQPQKLQAHLGQVSPLGSADPVELVLKTGNLKVKTDILSIEKVWIDTCQRPGMGKTRPENCDRQPFFERDLVRAIVKNGECMAERPKDETLSFALEVNHRTKKTRLFVGGSGSLGGSDAKSTVACVQRTLSEPDWDAIAHDYTRYVIGVLVSYPAQKRQ